MAMPSQRDVELLDGFLRETLDTVSLVIERGDIRARERHALSPALQEFAEGHPRLILNTYQKRLDPDLEAAGVLRKQLEAKVELPRVFAERIRIESGVEDDQTDTFETAQSRWPSGPSTGNVRRWIKRAKILVGTLAGLLPPMEALSELLDLLDAALDRPA